MPVRMIMSIYYHFRPPLNRLIPVKPRATNGIYMPSDFKSKTIGDLDTETN